MRQPTDRITTYARRNTMKNHFCKAKMRNGQRCTRRASMCGYCLHHFKPELVEEDLRV